MDARCGPSPGFAVRELGPDAGAGPGRHRLPAALFTPEYDAQTKGEGRGVPQGLHRRGYSPEGLGTSPPPPAPGPRHPSSSGPTQASATPGGAGRWPQRTLVNLPICYSLDGAATTEPGARAAGLAGAGD